MVREVSLQDLDRRERRFLVVFSFLPPKAHKKHLRKRNFRTLYIHSKEATLDDIALVHFIINVKQC